MTELPEYAVNRVSGERFINPRSGLLVRGLPTMPPADALDLLQQKLAQATVLYENEGDSGRTGGYRAIIEVIQYLSSQGFPPGALSPLMGIAAAFCDADEGVQPPMFKPNRRHGAPPKPKEIGEFEQYLAVIVECCIRHYRDRVKAYPFKADALREAARLIQQSRHKLKISTRRLEEIRERVRQVTSGSFDRALFDDHVSAATRIGDPLSYASRLIDHPSLTRPPYFST